jgi:hypothetical protein
MRKNEAGPHQISSVEENSPAMLAGLKNDDLLLKVNDVNVVGERYSKTVTLIKNESERGRLKLEVIEPQLCPLDIRNAVLPAPSDYSTLSSRNKEIKIDSSGRRSSKAESIQNLRDIAGQIISSANIPIDRRAVSEGPVSQRTQSMTNIQNSTVRSTNSFGSTTTALSGGNTTIKNKISL